MTNTTHPAIRKRKHRIGIFSVAVWVIGGGFAMYLIVVTRNPWLFLLLVAVATIGAPLSDVGPPHRWVIREWHRRAQWRRDKGQMMVPALLGEPKGPPCDMERVEGVLARVNTQTGYAFVPILTDESRDYATLALKLSGASPQWLQSDPAGKFAWNLQWFEGIAEALGITNDPEVEVIFTHIHRPADVERMIRLGKVRYDKKYSVAAQNAPETWEGTLGRNLADRINGVYDIAGHPREYVFLRMPWPRAWKGKIGVHDAGAFERSPLYRMILRIRGVFRQNGITAELLSPLETQELWDEFMNVTNLPAIRLYRQRNRDLEQLRSKRRSKEAQSKTDTPVDGSPEDKTLELMMAQTLRSADPDTPGYLCYGGTYHIAGYVKEVKKDFLPPGFRRGFNLDDDVYWTMSVYVRAKLRDTEAFKAKEAERGLNMTEGLNPLDKGVTDVTAQRQWQEAVNVRRRLDEASNRVPHSDMLVSVAGHSLKEAEARWKDMVVQLATIYDFERLYHRDDIEDALLAQLGKRTRSL